MIKCPPLIPEKYFTYQSNLIKLGYSDASETFESYLSRMNSYVVLFAAIIQTKPFSPAEDNPFGLSFGWKWLACTLNNPALDSTTSLIASFIEIAGYAMLEGYKSNFAALLSYIKNEYVQRIAKETHLPSKKRLEILIDKIIDHNGKCFIEEPSERHLDP